MKTEEKRFHNVDKENDEDKESCLKGNKFTFLRVHVNNIPGLQHACTAHIKCTIVSLLHMYITVTAKRKKPDGKNKSEEKQNFEKKNRNLRRKRKQKKRKMHT